MEIIQLTKKIMNTIFIKWFEDNTGLKVNKLIITH